MNGAEKTFSTCFSPADERTDPEAVLFGERHAGIIISMVVHAIIILLFFLNPVSRMATVKTFHISFTKADSLIAGELVSTRTAGQAEKATLAVPAARHAAKPKQGETPARTVTAPAVVPKETPTKTSTPIASKAIAEKSVETTLPSAPQSVTGDEFFAAPATLPSRGASDLHVTTMGSGTDVTGLRSGAAGGSMTSSGSGASPGTGVGSVAPIDTIFGETNAPCFIHRALPVYPLLALQRGKEGRVVLTLLIDKNGKVQNINVTEPAGYGLTEAAIEAVKKSTFAPARVDGQKVASRAVLPIRFRIE